MRPHVFAAGAFLSLGLFTGPHMASSVRAQNASPRSIGVLLDDAAEVPVELVEAVQGALLEALADVEGYAAPTLLPATLVDAQLTLGCAAVDAECLSTIAQTAQLDAVLVRRLHADAEGATTLELVLSARSDVGFHNEAARATIAAGSNDALAAQVHRLVREVFRLPEPEGADASPPTLTRGTEISEPVAEAPLPQSSRSPKVTPVELHVGSEPDAVVHGVGTAAWVTTAAGAAMLALGVGLGLSANAHFDDVKATPVETRADAQRVRRDFDDVERLGTAANVLMPVGAATLAVGALLMVLDLSEVPDGREARAVGVGILPARRGALLVIDGRLSGN